MTDNGSERIDQYLLAEMTDTERENFEDRMMANDALFFSVASRENDLVDGYAGNSLPSQLNERFRSSLSTFPARRQKIANAEVLRDYIADGKGESVSAERVPWYQRLGFAFRVPAIASAALGVLLLGVIGFLVVQNRNLNGEVAQLERLRQREAELETALESERNAAGDLTSDLDSERARRARLEAELKELRRQIANTKPAANETPLSPTIATLILRPTGIRGGPAPVHRLDLKASVDRVSLLLVLPGDAKADARVDISLNGKPVAKNLKIRTRPDGTKSLQTVINTKDLTTGRNILTVNTDTGQVAEYIIQAERNSQ